MVIAPQIIILKEINIPEALIQLRSDGIIHVHYKKNTTVDVETQRVMRDIFRQMAPGKKLPYIFSASSGVTITKEARENSNVPDSPIGAYAIIANNLAYRLVANFYLKVNKPVIPSKLFSTIEDALEWIYTLNV